MQASAYTFLTRLRTFLCRERSKMHNTFSKLGHYVNLSQGAEVQRDGIAPDVQRLKKGHPVTASQTNLNRSRYKHNDANLYIVAEDPRTDYSQPPMSDVYYGVLNTGRRRYGHPALSGQLPHPWLPMQRPTKSDTATGISTTEGVVIDLRRRWSVIKKSAKSLSPANRSRAGTPGLDDSTRAWRDGAASDADHGDAAPDLGVIALSDDEEEDDEAAVRYKTYFTKRSERSRLPGAWAQEQGDESVDSGDEH